MNQVDAQQLKLSETHLQMALKAGLSDPDAAHGLLSEIYLRSGKPELAEVHLSRAVKTRPHLRLRYAQVLAMQDKKARAADEAKLAANFFKDRAVADIADKSSRIGWAESLTFLEDFPQAVAVLQDGIHLANDDAYRRALSRICGSWQSFVERKEPENLALQWTLLERGLQFDPSNVTLLNRLLHYLESGADQAEKARAVLRQILAKGEATATTHFLLGMDAWQRKDAKAAELHWERAQAMNPNLIVVGNNLAWVLAFSEKADLPRALRTIELVLEKAPNEPAFRDTRAKIQAKAGHWREALNDYEWILRRQPNFPGLHDALAQAYTELGDNELAAEHRRLAQARDRANASTATTPR
jgi:tetratricopeptide (TPR) repeat protein